MQYLCKSDESLIAKSWIGTVILLVPKVMGYKMKALVIEKAGFGMNKERGGFVTGKKTMEGWLCVYQKLTSVSRTRNVSVGHGYCCQLTLTISVNLTRV